MKRYFALSVGCVLLIFSSTVSAQTAVEKAEKRLADLLAPGSGGAAVTLTSKPLAWKGAQTVEAPAAPIKPYAGTLIRLPRTPGKEVKPRSAPEASPLLAQADKTPPPKEVELPTKPLIRLPSVDINTPLPIPILAQPVQDRASLGDPALEASLQAALRPLTPSRDRPVPFAPLNLPDPFEHIRTGQFRNPPEEIATPPVIPVSRPPTK